MSKSEVAAVKNGTEDGDVDGNGGSWRDRSTRNATLRIRVRVFFLCLTSLIPCGKKCYILLKIPFFLRFIRLQSPNLNRIQI